MFITVINFLWLFQRNNLILYPLYANQLPKLEFKLNCTTCSYQSPWYDWIVFYFVQFFFKKCIQFLSFLSSSAAIAPHLKSCQILLVFLFLSSIHKWEGCNACREDIMSPMIIRIIRIIMISIIRSGHEETSTDRTQPRN